MEHPRFRLIQGGKSREIVVLNAGDEAFGRTMADWIREVAGDEYQIKFRSTCYGDELLELGKRYHIDIFTLLLNSIILSSGNCPPRNRMNKALDIVAHIKAEYGSPVLAFYGFPDDDNFADQARSAGADFVFKVPAPATTLNEAIKVSLAMIHRLNSACVDG